MEVVQRGREPYRIFQGLTCPACRTVMESLKIILLCILSAVVYGILHDQVTARVCVEYFTIGHPPIFQTDSPTLLAFGWGVIATWWVGGFLGFVAADVSRLGSWPKFAAARLVRPIALLMVVTACVSLVAGIVGYNTAQAGGVWLTGPVASRIPAERHTVFLADAWTHLAAYGVGFLGGIVLCVWVLYRRWREAGTKGTDGGHLSSNRC
jgi:hypothetical protein